MDLALKSLLIKLRGTQPLNYLTTTTLRAFVGGTASTSERIVRHVQRLGPVECKLPNNRTLRLKSQLDDYIPNRVFWMGLDGYEPETAPVFFRLAQRSAVTLDIGSHIGLFALIAGHANERGRVYAFEPVPEIAKRLKHHVEINGLKNVTCVETAVSDFDGTSEIYHGAGAAFTGSLSKQFMHWQTDWKTTEVSVITIDRFVRDNDIPKIDLVKIDTESTEPQVLRGMIATIERDRPNIICEVLATLGVEEPLAEILKPFGYKFYQLTDEGIVHRSALEGSLEFRNYLFSVVPPHEISALAS